MRVKKSSITGSIVAIFCDYCQQPIKTKYDSELSSDTDILNISVLQQSIAPIVA